MAKPKIDAQQALDDIRSGMDDQALMEKYNVSAKGLESLFTKMLSAGVITQADLDRRASESRGKVDISKYVSELARTELKGRRVNAQEAVRDIKAGISDADLMENYRLSAKGLQDLFGQLVEAGLVAQAEIDRRSAWIDSTVDLIGILRELGLDPTSKSQKTPAEVPSRCVACGAPQTMEFDECPMCGTNIAEFKAKMAQREQAGQSAWVCPACGKAQNEVHEECPLCGIVVAKYLQKRAREAGTDTSKK